MVNVFLNSLTTDARAAECTDKNHYFRQFPKPRGASLTQARNFAGLRIHAHEFAFFNEKRHANDEAVSSVACLLSAAGGGVAAQTRFC